jgi:hypothetical protein
MPTYWLLSVCERLQAGLHERAVDANSWVANINAEVVCHLALQTVPFSSVAPSSISLVLFDSLFFGR